MILHRFTAKMLAASLMMSGCMIAAVAFAQQPAVDGSGEQTQSVNLAQDQVRVTGNSRGSMNASSADGSLNASGSGSAAAHTPAGDLQGGLATGCAKQSGTCQQFLSTDPHSNPAQASDSDAPDAESSGGGAADCFNFQLSGQAVTAEAIGGMGEGTQISIMLHCDATVRLSTDLTDAVNENASVMQMLQMEDIDIVDIVAITIDAQGVYQMHVISR